MTGRNAQSTRGNGGDGFSIVELLIAIFIIGLLVSISLVVIAKARRSAQMARVKSDFVAVGMALDQFKADHKAYPGIIPNIPPGVDQSNALAYCLMSPEDATVDGADGPGFRVQKNAPNTKKWPAYLDSSKFKVVKEPTLPDGRKVQRGSGGWELLDAYDMPIVYMPRRRPAVRPDVALLGYYSRNGLGAYDLDDVVGIVADQKGLEDAIRRALGDANKPNPNNKIDPGETANFSGDYILMSAGPDGAYFTGSDATAFQKADDVYNFDR